MGEDQAGRGPGSRPLGAAQGFPELLAMVRRGAESAEGEGAQVGGSLRQWPHLGPSVEDTGLWRGRERVST